MYVWINNFDGKSQKNEIHKESYEGALSSWEFVSHSTLSLAEENNTTKQTQKSLPGNFPLFFFSSFPFDLLHLPCTVYLLVKPSKNSVAFISCPQRKEKKLNERKVFYYLQDGKFLLSILFFF